MLNQDWWDGKDRERHLQDNPIFSFDKFDLAPDTLPRELAGRYDTDEEDICGQEAVKSLKEDTGKWLAGKTGNGEDR